MTTQDIERVQINLITKNGTLLVGATDNAILLNLMAEFVQFTEIDPSKYVTLMLTEIIRKQESQKMLKDAQPKEQNGDGELVKLSDENKKDSRNRKKN